MQSKWIASFVMAAMVAGCGGGKTEQIYDDEGKERISILTSTTEITADKTLAALNVALPRPYVNGSWSQPGGNATHSVGHVALDESLSKAWTAKVGKGSNRYEHIVSGPVADEGRVFAMDVKGSVSAFDVTSGNKLWTAEIDSTRDRSEVNYGGGTAVADGRVFATSGLGYLVALDAQTGQELWRFQATVPFRGAPTASAGRVFAVTHDNQMIAVSAETGEYVWDQVGIPESASMLGAAAPASDGQAVIMALSSGELVAFLGANGQVLWQDTLAASNRLTPLATLADIDGSPVIANGRVYAVSHAGSMVAIDIRTGERSWETDIAAVNTPWIAGPYAFVATIDGQIAAVTLGDGRIRWATQLQRFENQDEREGLVKWNGPVLAGDRLIVTSSHGYVLSLSPYTGEILSSARFGNGSSLPHIVVDETLVILNDDGELVAYR